MLVSLGDSFYVFFFFKQKTAYEMCISDWSSDVCSSDLQCQRVVGRAIVDNDQFEIAERLRLQAGERLGQQRGTVIRRHDHADDGRAHATEIGRASCRERVCKYV